ncbi:nuclear transport factor 2 family protein [Janthinobacterium sp. CG_S6]|uniref:nuclear transport factor 2 family protein n=1 Tax=unclassified Janthinobacterium TaxID=2610881 RepID=UPI00035D59D5|nr:nuclear transport factor 2 family protein [Janthinobacterium sp. CG3]MEC5160990.1 steroid delta-isomerase [Janthinobacterium sp. CG_S6]
MSMERNYEGELARLVHFYENLSLRTVPEVRAIYAPDASFKDPFNEVRGHAAIVHIFEHMYVQVYEPGFRVVSQIGRADEAFLTWEFRFRMKRLVSAPQCVRGATHIRFDADGLVSMHRDYWDAAEELYEKLPLLGGFMRLLKNAARR